MAKRNLGAIAIDLGASSGRFAAGWLEDGKICHQVVEQIPHRPKELRGRLTWDLDALLNLCRRATDYASANFGHATLGIDAWGVDHGFIGSDGELIGEPVCYRDLSHAEAFAELAPYRQELYSLTGIQHQPFNTICQLIARLKENPSLGRQSQFLILPDLLGYLLTGETNYELTEASTTQLMGLDSQWSDRAFQIARWPVPDLAPAPPGRLGAKVADTVELAHIGSHDTASALLGFGLKDACTMAVNVGTWSLAMFTQDNPIATPEAESANFTNERMTDGRVRFLKNIPGFYVVNRLHQELGIQSSVPVWLSMAIQSNETVDLFAEDFFNPDSMVEACAAKVRQRPASESEWASLILDSLASAIAKQPAQALELGVTPTTSIRIGGGGSQSQALCQRIADLSGLTVFAGPVEATVLGNLALQMLAAGQFDSEEAMNSAIRASFESKEYRPA
jgi:rhamnulokinase